MCINVDIKNATATIYVSSVYMICNVYSTTFFLYKKKNDEQRKSNEKNNGKKILYLWLVEGWSVPGMGQNFHFRRAWVLLIFVLNY